MAKFITDYLDKYSRAMTNHENWAYLDSMTAEEQLDVIQHYTHRKENQKYKYIVVVFTCKEETL